MRAEVIVHAGSIVGVPDDLARWKGDRARVELPPTAVVASSGELALETNDGWPVEVCRVVCSDESGVLLEHRVVAYYRFLHHVGVVLVRAREAEALIAHESEVLAFVRSARPDFRDDGVIALSEIWEL